MVHQIAQEGALWPSDMRFGPDWLNSKISWASIVTAVPDVGTRNIIKLHNYYICLDLTNLVQAKSLIKTINPACQHAGEIGTKYFGQNKSC